MEQIKERFWMQIQRDVGLIPEHIINILDFCGYSANCSLEAIDVDKIKIIEREAKEIPQVLRIPGSDEQQMQKYFGKFYRNPSNFQILSGEAQQIIMIGLYLRQKGIGSYIKIDELSRERRRKDCASEISSLEQAARTLGERIHTFYYNRCDGSPQNIEFCNTISSLQVTTEFGEDGNMVGHVTCPFCQMAKKLRVSQDRSGHWVLANIVAHMKRHLANITPNYSDVQEDSIVTKKVKLESSDNDDSSQYSSNAYGFTMTMT
ncbi:uncharacterized protein LOC131430127 isoform X1 [Malaya genurostris]|uniref:uncharacterized protein LOC131430127 isoform X1 n=1 Tax=Malaya genurostris TaxID=325434 RepID=UPI0026F3EB4D|nr:uncharacterized protein LOC131430127 isoform X1 [Malaya genurostris]XP_058450829.1 uncharacterized protein LOC131430127 isoform X1 [Malaya genurostris]XP_058450830.1 uncharacterized protein LOC131430127 isoform X1 [Malaya genurostris]